MGLADRLASRSEKGVCKTKEKNHCGLEKAHRKKKGAKEKNGKDQGACWVSKKRKV